jgi:hypothetical protein
MTAHGGARSGAGRPKGGANRLNDEARRVALGDGISPLEFLLGIMRDVEQAQETRLDAAKAAAPYVHAKLQAIQHSGDAENPVEVITRVELVAPEE